LSKTTFLRYPTSLNITKNKKSEKTYNNGKGILETGYTMRPYIILLSINAKKAFRAIRVYEMKKALFSQDP